MTINCKGKLIDLSKPVVAGILNITPDSFYDGGKYNQIDAVRKRIREMIVQGALIIDVGAYSSRPGAAHISGREEQERLIPVLQLIRSEFNDLIVSLDTFRPEIARFAVREFQIDIINDITSGNHNGLMLETIAELQVPYIMMHMNGTPQTMQNNPVYKDLFKEILMFFAEKINKAKQIGINDLIIDPGFGFGKNIEHNFLLLKELEKFSIFELPLMVGISRKSMLFKFLDLSPDDVLPATTALNMVALQKGANMLRVHDVKDAVQTVAVFNKLNSV